MDQVSPYVGLFLAMGTISVAMLSPGITSTLGKVVVTVTGSDSGPVSTVFSKNTSGATRTRYVWSFSKSLMITVVLLVGTLRAPWSAVLVPTLLEGSTSVLPSLLSFSL